MEQNQILFAKSGIVILFLIAVMVAEHFLPAVKIRKNLNRLAKNFSLAGLNFLISPLIVLPISQFASTHALGIRPLWWNFIFDLLILDAWIYGWHRLNHIVPFLWRFHEVHHLDETLDSSTALRFHFGEVVLSALVRALVIWLLSVPFFTVALFEAMLVIAALFQHSNVRLPLALEARLSEIIVTPSLHWVHHHAKREDTDSNYSTILSIWDRIFKSRSNNRRTLAMKMGVEGGKDENILRLILRPFWKA